jgi:hypothetical protein
MLNNTEYHKTIRTKRKGIHAKTKSSKSKNSKLYVKLKIGQG